VDYCGERRRRWRKKKKKKANIAAFLQKGKIELRQK
jgi:hypothetical protein